MDDNTPGKVQPRLRGSISAHFSQSLAGIVPGAQHPPSSILKAWPIHAADTLCQSLLLACPALASITLVYSTAKWPPTA